MQDQDFDKVVLIGCYTVYRLVSRPTSLHCTHTHSQAIQFAFPTFQLNAADSVQFLSCISMPMYAQRDIVMEIMSVCKTLVLY